jgi:cell division protein FtsW (lipid II flippase)
VAGDEPVTSPDQRKPVNPRKARIGAVLAVIILLLFLLPLHQFRVEDLWLVVLAGLIVLMIIVDWVLRRNGLRE